MQSLRLFHHVDSTNKPSPKKTQSAAGAVALGRRICSAHVVTHVPWVGSSLTFVLDHPSHVTMAMTPHANDPIVNPKNIPAFSEITAPTIWSTIPTVSTRITVVRVLQTPGNRSHPVMRSQLPVMLKACSPDVSRPMQMLTSSLSARGLCCVLCVGWGLVFFWFCLFSVIFLWRARSGRR